MKNNRFMNVLLKAKEENIAVGTFWSTEAL